MINKMFGHVNLLEKSLDATWLRQEVIAQNLANVDTPGYDAKRVHFEDAFADALLDLDSSFPEKKTRAKHIEFSGHAHDPMDVEAVVTADTHYSMRMDDNNVDADSEMVELAKNTIQYNALVTKLNSEFARLRMAIREGK